MVLASATSSRFAPAIAGKAPVAAPSVQFVLAVECGAMETMAIRLVHSLRRWGGRFAWAPVLAVKPRFSPPLRRSTLREFERLGVVYRAVRPTHGLAWYTWMNKPTSLIAAEESTDSTDTICWLDADMLVLREPEAIILHNTEDFAACPADKNAGTAGPADPFDPYWAALAARLGLSLDQLPWVVTHREQARIRMYFNGGLFVYRRSSAFGERFMNNCRQLIDARINSKTQGLYLTEQIALGLTAVAMKLRWRALPWSHNYAIGRKLYEAGLYSLDGIRSASILHYHDAMWPHFYPQLLSDLQQARPDVAEWLRDQPPLDNGLPPLSRLTKKLVELHRQRQWRRHERQCQAF